MQIQGPVLGVVTSVLTRPADTTAYASGDLIASSTTAGSIVVPSFVIPRDKDAKIIEVRRAILYTNLTTGFDTFQGHIDIWSAPPTFNNGDNGAYSVKTGSANWVGHMTTEISSTKSKFGDGYALSTVCGPANADDYLREHFIVQRSPGDVLYWSLFELDATGFTPISGQTFTLALEIEQR